MAKSVKATSAFDVTGIIPDNSEKKEGDVQRPVSVRVSAERTLSKRETKSKRINLLVRPSVYEAIVNKANEEGVSVNTLINDFMEQILEQ